MTGVASKRGKRESERGMEAGQLPPHMCSTNNGDDRWARMDGPVRASKGLSTGGMLTERIASWEGKQKKGEAKKVERRCDDVSLCHFQLCIFTHSQRARMDKRSQLIVSLWTNQFL